MPLATATSNGLMPIEQFFDMDINIINDYNTFAHNGVRRTTAATLNSPFSSGDGQNVVIFIGTSDKFKTGIQATYSGIILKMRLYWDKSWGPWRTFSLT